MNLRSVRNVLEFVHALSRDQSGRPWLFRVPGHEGRTYLVSLLRQDGTIQTHCRRDTQRHQDCLGSTYHICYHSVAAALKAARMLGLKTAVCQDEATAYRVARLHPGAKITQVIARPSGKAWWIVTWEGEE